jgi:hypothetical protein
MSMTAGELRAIIADVPEDLPVAIRVSPNGYDAVAVVTVRAIGPRREPSLRDGVMTDDRVDCTSRRRHLVLVPTDRREQLEARLGAAGIEGWFDPDFEEWCVSGWSDEELSFDSIDRI